MTIRVSAIVMSHWHSLYGAAYLRHLSAMLDVQIVGVHDEREEVAAHRVAEIGGDVPIFTNYDRMLGEVEPDFVLALGRHDNMAETAHHLLNRGVPFVMEKPMSFNAQQLAGVVETARPRAASRPFRWVCARLSYYEPFTNLAWLAAQTRKIALGTTVIVVSYRHPVHLAHLIANADQLSDGRLIFGIGMGHIPTEFEALGVPYETRGAMTGNYLAVRPPSM